MGNDNAGLNNLHGKSAFMNQEKQKKFAEKYYSMELSSATSAKWDIALDNAAKKQTFLLVPANSKVLDIGCHTGKTLAKLVKKGCEPFGIELNSWAAKEAAKKGIKVTRADITKQLQFPDDFFDAVIIDHVLEHVFDTVGLLKEARRCLKKGGKIVVGVPNSVSLRDRILVAFGKLPAYGNHSDHIHNYSAKKLGSELEKAGFREIKLQGTSIVLLFFKRPIVIDAVLKRFAGLANYLQATATK